MGKSRKMFYHKARGLRITRLMARDGNSCTICYEPLDRKIKDVEDHRYITFDHILPVSLGGMTAMDNLRLAHLKCNNDRGNQPITPEQEEMLLNKSR